VRGCIGAISLDYGRRIPIFRGLTRREQEVLDLICADHTNAQIATKLFISAKTVDHHVSAVLAKLDARTRDVAASHAARLGLVGATEDRKHRRETG
jgi:DNA-binding CsgD family transcriptional regulator